MKNITLLLLSFFLYSFLFSQNNTKYLIEYRQATIDDTLSRKPYHFIENYYLYGSKEKSEYISVKKLAFDSLFKAENGGDGMLKRMLDFGPASKTNPRDWFGTFSNIYIVKNKTKDSIFSYKKQDEHHKHYFFSEEPIDMQWKIHEDTLYNDTMKVMCQKATTRYGGRNYTAWFAPDIPISDGPYKFNGLPGLIVNLFEDNMYYSFRALRILPYKELYFANTEMISKAKKMDREEFIKLDRRVPKGGIPKTVNGTQTTIPFTLDMNTMIEIE